MEYRWIFFKDFILNEILFLEAVESALNVQANDSYPASFEICRLLATTLVTKSAISFTGAVAAKAPK